MTLVRWGGLAGSALVAVAAYLGGLGFTRTPLLTPVQVLRGDQGLLVPLCWIAGLAILLAAWWYGRRVVPSIRWVLITVGLWFVPVLPMLPLGSADIYSYACQGYVQHAGGDPYAYGVQQFGCPWLDAVSTTWWDSPAPYGPLFLLVAGWAVAVGGSLAGTIAGLRVIALAGLALVAAGVVALARRLDADPAKAVWTVLACPLVLIHLVSGAHNDALMIGLMVVGLAVAVHRRSPAWLVAAGALLGLAGAVKATALVVLPFAALAAVPPGSRVRALVRPLALLGGGAVAALGAVSLAAGRGLGWVGGLLRSGDTITWTSPPTAVGLAINGLARIAGRHVNAVPVTRALGVAVLAVLLVLVWVRTRRSNAAITGAGEALTVTVACAPVLHPWYVTWPLAVLAAEPPKWMLIACAVAATLTLPGGYNWAEATRLPGSLLMTAALLVLAFRAGRQRALIP
ncbi:MAG TPA: polyprenol phosphomannose-dependent alpha 1,6 mannosyltransferase MptB [Actinoplanes sp.]